MPNQKRTLTRCANGGLWCIGRQPELSTCRQDLNHSPHSVPTESATKRLQHAHNDDRVETRGSDAVFHPWTDVRCMKQVYRQSRPRNYFYLFSVALPHKSSTTASQIHYLSLVAHELGEHGINGNTDAVPLKHSRGCRHVRQALEVRVRFQVSEVQVLFDWVR